MFLSFWMVSVLGFFWLDFVLDFNQAIRNLTNLGLFRLVRARFLQLHYPSLIKVPNYTCTVIPSLIAQSSEGDTNTDGYDVRGKFGVIACVISCVQPRFPVI